MLIWLNNHTSGKKHVNMTVDPEHLKHQPSTPGSPGWVIVVILSAHCHVILVYPSTPAWTGSPSTPPPSLGTSPSWVAPYSFHPRPQ